ncbi:nitroreductase family deazaflavin-dependent oxidoreductase [Microbacterium kyungheense]|uniref:Deazaflavin-dependent oxidoreductase (Nitroreductase family) n=1 Tax=Microbacterium kyungheense TaxID=1263636 RepID=A0A543FKA1_9MICO|nr:nitroreductase family deazaflavin-dependent oxidoreductase [Microbacterium kyungheense]TQM34300.1 deazaflavin-dependent oxidoreductase (nitroreductase family) [Microbacterium kyungheense]
MTESATDPRRVSPTSRRPARPTALIDRLIEAVLRTRWVVRAPIPLYRAGLGWIFGDRLVMIEHLGRVSHDRRFVVVEVVDREPNAIRVASGFGTRAQWYRNLQANGVAYLSTGGARHVRAAVRLLDRDESEARLAAYAARHPRAWRHLKAAMDDAAGGDAYIPIVEFVPPPRSGR